MSLKWYDECLFHERPFAFLQTDIRMNRRTPFGRPDGLVAPNSDGEGTCYTRIRSAGAYGLSSSSRRDRQTTEDAQPRRAAERLF
jgi:hypothetical protein